MTGFAQPIQDALKTALQPVRQQLWNMASKRRQKNWIRDVEVAYVDPRITYPSYKSFDEFIDLERLKSLDSYIQQRLADRDEDSQFWTGPFTHKGSNNRYPGSRVVELTRRKNEHFDYFELDRPDAYELSEAAEEFSEVMDFIRTLPFKNTARMMIMYDFNGRPVTAHRDHYKTDMCSEFLWFRTNLTKPFYMMNHKTGERKYVESYSAWFDVVNQFHGADAADGLSISLRVDGEFTDEFRALIPKLDRNIASTPSYWATVGGVG